MPIENKQWIREQFEKIAGCLRDLLARFHRGSQVTARRLAGAGTRGRSPDLKKCANRLSHAFP